MSTKKAAFAALLAILIIWPVAYIFIRTYGLPPLQEQQSNAVAVKPDDLPALETAARTNPSYDNLVNLASAYINKGMPGKSVSPLQQALQINPRSAVAYNDLGVAYTMMQQYGEGVSYCTKALEADSSFQLAKNNLKWATGERDKVLATIRDQEQTPESKRDVAFYSDCGLNYFRVGDYSKSIEVWNKIFDLDPKSTGALNSIGTAFMMKGQTDDAIALFKKALELEPGNQLAKNNLVWALDEKSRQQAGNRTP